MRKAYDCPVCGGENTLKIKIGNWTGRGRPKLVYWCCTKGCAVTLIHVGRKSDDGFRAFTRQMFRENATGLQKVAAWLIGCY